MIKPIHPFPARMAPELALSALKDVPSGGVVLDPMVGSGTVVRQASELGLSAIGFDMDPLAVLMARVWTTPIEDATIDRLATKVIGTAKGLSLDRTSLPWMDEDEETRDFVRFWFGEAQRSDLRRIASVLHDMQTRRTTRFQLAAVDVLRVALSRIIITKDSGASLARDVSHSRPHRVKTVSTYDVFSAFERSVDRVRSQLITSPPPGKVAISLGDARALLQIPNHSIHAIMTSPPYLNAIDYMRGHRLSLVWLGHRLSDLRTIRSNSVGAERGSDALRSSLLFEEIQSVMGSVDQLPARLSSMVDRYVEDIYRLMSETARVLVPEGRATLVVGNSCLRGTFINNSEGFATAGGLVGLRLLDRVDRDLPSAKRYLPITSTDTGPLSKRMKSETILTFLA